MNGHYSNGNQDENIKEFWPKRDRPDIVDEYKIDSWMNKANNDAVLPNFAVNLTNTDTGSPVGWGAPPPAPPSGWSSPAPPPPAGWGLPSGIQQHGWDTPSPPPPFTGWNAPSGAPPAGWDSPPSAPSTGWDVPSGTQPLGWDVPPSSPPQGWDTAPSPQPAMWDPAPEGTSAVFDSPLSAQPLGWGMSPGSDDMDTPSDEWPKPTEMLSADSFAPQENQFTGWAPPPQELPSEQELPPKEEPVAEPDIKKISPIVKFVIPILAIIVVAVALLYIFVFSNGGGDGNGNDDGNNSGANIDAGGEVSETPSPVTSTDNNMNNEKPSAAPTGDQDEEDELYEDGKLIRQTLRDARGEIIGWCEFRYYNNGVLMEEIEFSTDSKVKQHTYYDTDGSVSERWENEYDGFGRMTMTTLYNKDGIREFSSSYTYNVAGVNTSRTDSAYGDFGELLRYEVYDLFGNGNYRTISTYRVEDGVERIYEEITYNSNAKLVMRTTYEYDESGDLTKRFDYEYEPERTLELFIHEYNESNIRVHTIEYDYDENGEETERRELEYNNSGVVVRTRYFRPGATNPYRTEPPATTQPTTSQPPTSNVCTNPGHGEYDANQTPRTTFDEQGRRYRDYYYYRDGCVWYYTQYFYDSNGNIIDIVRYYS